ncbi:MAG TPA: protein kinase [Planctomycetota bacterium]|nr:protein kinase [Planctomycetota bacterium]
MTSPEPRPLLPGTRLAHYVLRTPIGSGSMGTVYEAHDTALDRTVAVKVVNPALVGSPEALDRFLHEARAAARVSHDRVTHIHFVGTDDGRPFYAMELVPGRTLEEIVRADGPLPFATAIDVLRQAAEGLGAAHEAGFVHRDVKPSNLILRPDGGLKVTDFGLAKSMSGDPGATHVGNLVGTPEFMSPEQCRGQPVDARTDVYTLGLTAFWLLTGERPFGGGSVGAMLDAQMNAPLPSAAARRPDLPARVDDVLARLTAKDRERRPESMREVLSLLEDLRPRAVHPAPLTARAIALVVDTVAFAVVGSAVVTGAAQPDAYVPGALLGAIVSLVTFAVVVASQYGMEVRFGGSLGKLLLGLEVVRDDGTRPGRRALLARLLVRFPTIPFILVPDDVLPDLAEYIVGYFQLGVIAAGVITYLATRGRTLSDLLTGTRVAYRAPPAAARGNAAERRPRNAAKA